MRTVLSADQTQSNRNWFHTKTGKVVWSYFKFGGLWSRMDGSGRARSRQGGAAFLLWIRRLRVRAPLGAPTFGCDSRL